jgi:flagellar export protein FliJ
MKRFSSRYEKICHLRAQQEDVCRAAAAARNAERAAAEQYRDTVQTWLDSIEKSAASDLGGGLSGAMLNSMTSQISRGQEDLNSASQSLNRTEEKLHAALLEHKQARAELKIVEEVIHREHTEHQREQLRQQEHQMQEQASQAFHRKQELSRSNKS